LFIGLVRDDVRIENRQGGDVDKTEKSCKGAVGFKMPQGLRKDMEF
jgi:hypothetical protein